MKCNSLEIRAVFERGQFYRRWDEGEFRTYVRREGPPLTRPGEAFPSRYQKQAVAYLRRDGYPVAWVHERAGDQFGYPAPGTWADPKFVYHHGVKYRFSEEEEDKLFKAIEALFRWLGAEPFR